MSALVKPCQTIDGKGGCWGQQEVRNGACGELQVLETHDGRPGAMKEWRRLLHKKSKIRVSAAELRTFATQHQPPCPGVCVLSGRTHVSSCTRSHTCHHALTSSGPCPPVHLTLTSVAHRLQVVAVTSPAATRL